ncbi:nucleoside kinase [uncultured Holdemania sp.]|uniref:nucleoside kinase n=1 Tax=uncultured Holdemania sp. TaxID=527664 RepID=UPI002804C1F0|nr:nucleoside kinase [uncultured Holdemania sp.]
MLTLRFPDQSEIQVQPGLTIAQLAAKQDDPLMLAGGILNGKVHDLNYRLNKSGAFEWIRRDSLIGQMMTERTLSFLLITAVRLCFNGTDVLIEHSLAGGLYGTLIREKPVTSQELEQIKTKMQEMIDKREPIYRRVVSKAAAVAHFETLGMHDKASLLRQRTSAKCSVYTCAGVDDYFYGVMLPDASWITHFTLQKVHQGFWLSTEKEFVDQPKLFEVYRQFEQRGRETGISMISQLNEKIREGCLPQIIADNESRVARDLDRLADQITACPELKIVLIAGPSSAGKTTFSRRLALALRQRGRDPIAISMDDFFLNREDSPRLPDGTHDYENIECLDLKLFNASMEALIGGLPVVLPTYDFKLGEKRFVRDPLTLKPAQILILEGLHALNPRSSENIAEAAKFRVYINALTHLNLDRHNRITTTDYRLIRRMTRDYQFRGRSVQSTLDGWEQVKAGEDRYIYPYQEQADCLFNTSMDYELPILKTILAPLLDQVPVDAPEYIEANRIRRLLAYFDGGDPALVPHDSILAEFIGGSVFEE